MTRRNWIIIRILLAVLQIVATVGVGVSVVFLVKGLNPVYFWLMWVGSWLGYNVGMSLSLVMCNMSRVE